MITNGFTHYQTCFKVEKRTADVPAFDRLKTIIFDWVKSKETDRLLQTHASEFFYRCDWSNLYITRSSVGTNTFKSDEFDAWGFRFTELDREIGARRYWYTDVGMKDEGGVVTFYAKLTYARSQHDLTFEHPIPVTTLPNFIRRILDKDSGLRVFSGRQQFGLFDRPVPLWKPGHGKVLCDFILSEERRYPLVVFNGDVGHQSQEAVNLAGILAGKAQVLVLKEDMSLAEEIRHYLPQDLRIPFGKLRVFFPLNPKFPRPERHRWYNVQDVDYPSQRAGIINGLLRSYELREDRAIQSISDVGRLITLANLGRFKEDNPQQSEQLNEFYGLLTEAEKQRDESRRETEHWVHECDQHEKEIHGLKSKLAALDGVDRDSKNTRRKAAVWDTMTEHPSALVDILMIFSRVYADRIAVTEQAVKTARDYTDFTDSDEAWPMFHHLCTTLYEMRFGEDRAAELENTFKQKSGRDLGMSEGKSTKRDAGLMKIRQLVFEGVEYDITPHLKWGNREPKMLRIHFSFDEERQRIVVGYVGPHLDNATTRTVN